MCLHLCTLVGPRRGALATKASLRPVDLPPPCDRSLEAIVRGMPAAVVTADHNFPPPCHPPSARAHRPQGMWKVCPWLAEARGREGGEKRGRGGWGGGRGMISLCGP